MEDASEEPLVMPLELLRQITDDFSEERLLGSGSYGKVYLGVFPDGENIAVKKLYDMPGLDDKQFLNEFKNLTRLRHQNIVRLVGYCRDIQEVHVMYEGKLVVAEKAHRALCLEYMSNGSLDMFLSDQCDRYNWPTCYGIIKGICQGLKYLHHELKPSIYHLDLKPANVLLDKNMVPRIADFGISRLFSGEQTRSTQSLLGTRGYSPPEFIHNRLISKKFDIFSLGVVIIKMMAGCAGYYDSAEMPSEEFTYLVQENWAKRLHEASNLRRAYSQQVKICIEIGLSCVQQDRHKRPTIQDIVDRLNETVAKCAYAARRDLLTCQDKECKKVLLKEAKTEGPVSNEESNNIFQRTYKTTLGCTSSQPLGDVYMAKPPTAAERFRSQLEEQARATAEYQRHNVELKRQVTELQDQLQAERAIIKQVRQERERLLEEERRSRQLEIHALEKSFMKKLNDLTGTKQTLMQQITPRSTGKENTNSNVSRAPFQTPSTIAAQGTNNMIPPNQLAQAAKLNPRIFRPIE